MMENLRKNLHFYQSQRKYYDNLCKRALTEIQRAKRAQLAADRAAQEINNTIEQLGDSITTFIEDVPKVFCKIQQAQPKYGTIEINGKKHAVKIEHHIATDLVKQKDDELQNIPQVNWTEISAMHDEFVKTGRVVLRMQWPKVEKPKPRFYKCKFYAAGMNGKQVVPVLATSKKQAKRCIRKNYTVAEWISVS